MERPILRRSAAMLIVLCVKIRCLESLLAISRSLCNTINAAFSSVHFQHAAVKLLSFRFELEKKALRAR